MSGNSLRKWYYMYEQLKFAKENPEDGNRVSFSKLNSWVNSQRVKYKEGKLSKVEIKLLEELGIELESKPKDKEIDWDDAYSYLEEYFASYGNIAFPNTFVTNDGFKIGIWLSNQKSKYLSDKLSIEKSNKLNDLYIIWSSRDNNIELKAFCEKYHIYYSINKDRMSKLPISRLEFIINYLIDRDISYIDSNGYLLDIIFVPYIENMIDINIEDDYSYMLKR